MFRLKWQALSVLVACLMSAGASAADSSISGVRIGVLDTRGSFVLFSVTGGVPTAICSHYGRQFYLDTSTAAGRLVYQSILSAKLTNAVVDILYTNSATPGVFDAACLGANMARPWSLVIS